MTDKEPIFDYLESICELIPTNFYWLDAHGVCLGLNTISRESIGAKSKEEVIGKSVYEFYPDYAIADQIQQYIDEVLKTGITSTNEDKIIDITTNAIKYFSSTRAPLKNKNGVTIGLVGTAIEITAQKEVERLKYEAEKEAGRLKLENERLILESKAMRAEKEAEHLKYEKDVLQAAATEQEKFKKDVGQMVHDMTSPIASINTIVSKLGGNIPENDRVTLRAAADRMEGISGRLFKQYENKDIDKNEKVETLAVSLALLQIMNEKREEHFETEVNFVVTIDENARFCFIQHNSDIFKRMISNLVNNAVDALKSTDSKEKPDNNSASDTADNSSANLSDTSSSNKIHDKEVTVSLSISPKSAIVSIKDNGPGMPQHIQDLFNEGKSVSEGKGEAGHGIGLTQIHDAIVLGDGRTEIYADKNGTDIIMFFPLTPAPRWIATRIKLNAGDTVLILDDDQSIHGAWKNKFVDILAGNPTLKTQHFFQGKEAIAYINKLTPEQKHNTILLTDYELIDQGMNGLDVVEKTNMLRAILVTSYATKPKIQERVAMLGIKTLPKELVSLVEIEVDKKLVKGSKVVDMVWVEDQEWYIESLVKKHYSHLKIDRYNDPISFMESVMQYPYDTRIILDTYYEYGTDGKHYKQTGYDLAEKLHGLGYTKLIILAGEAPKDRAPKYLQVLRKKNGKDTESLHTV